MSEKTQQSQPRIVPNIYSRILAIMSELDYIERGKKTVNGQYRFVSHDQVTATLHPYLVKHGIVVVPSVEEVKQEGNRTEVKLTVSFVNAEAPQDNFTLRSIGYGVDSGDKGPGKAISYAYKYALLKTFCLETGDDPDMDANAAYEPAKCLEFEMLLPEGLGKKEKERMNDFLILSATELKKSVEDVKRDAAKRMPEFINAFKSWNKQPRAA